ncbi:MAG: hypothetical protein P9X22_08810 [Candidatus Zapsychrus exili]|nr:hypothetical protein [Candidatus Zapsychrus exili]
MGRRIKEEREFMIFRIFKRIFLAAFAILFLSNSCSAAIMVDGKPIKFGEEIALKSFHNKYLRAGSQNQVFEHAGVKTTFNTDNSAVKVSAWEKLILYKAGNAGKPNSPPDLKNTAEINSGDTVLIYSAHKRYLMAWDAPHAFNVSNGSQNPRGDWERFIIQDLGGGKVAFKTVHGNRHLRAGNTADNPHWNVNQSGEGEVGLFEKWTIERVGTPATTPATTPTTKPVITPATKPATKSVVGQDLAKAGFTLVPGSLSQISCGKTADGKTLTGVPIQAKGFTDGM